MKNKISTKATIRRIYEIKMTNGDIFHMVFESRKGVNEPHGVGQDISSLLASKYIIVTEGHYVLPGAISSINLKNTEAVSDEIKSVSQQDQELEKDK